MQTSHLDQELKKHLLCDYQRQEARQLFTEIHTASPVNVSVVSTILSQLTQLANEFRNYGTAQAHSIADGPLGISVCALGYEQNSSLWFRTYDNDNKKYNDPQQVYGYVDGNRDVTCTYERFADNYGTVQALQSAYDPKIIGGYVWGDNLWGAGYIPPIGRLGSSLLTYAQNEPGGYPLEYDNEADATGINFVGNYLNSNW